MFVGTGGQVVPKVIRSLAGIGLGPDKIMVNALLLNIALIIFGWRRYRQLLEEVEERRKAEEQARILAGSDSLTGYLNRRSMHDCTGRLIAEAAAQGQVVALMMLDLDKFKQINDFSGHSAGDKVLVECAERIAALLPENALLARLGGDEFACAVTFEKKRPEIIDQIASAIVEAVSEPIAINGSSVCVTASLGIARSDLCLDDGHANQTHTLFHMADIAMYHAKRQGRNCYFWFEMAMEEEVRFRGRIETGIRRGIPLGEFVPYYEQQVDLQSGEITGFEMLARWNSPELGLVYPEVFIPIAEQIGVIGDLSTSVIAQALEDAKDWDPRLTLSVNISPLQLQDPWFAQKLLKLLVESHFPPQRLEIEITESCLHENLGAVQTLFGSLRNQGIRVSLDDLGTGYSSLAQLRDLPFDRIKIDRTFVSNLAHDQGSAAIVDSLTQLGERLGLPITAEGVESGEVLKKLRDYGQIKAQGYFYGKPQPAATTRELLAKRGLLKPEAPVSRDAPDGTSTDNPASEPPLASNA